MISSLGCPKLLARSRKRSLHPQPSCTNGRAITQHLRVYAVKSRQTRHKTVCNSAPATGHAPGSALCSTPLGAVCSVPEVRMRKEKACKHREESISKCSRERTPVLAAHVMEGAHQPQPAAGNTVSLLSRMHIIPCCRPTCCYAVALLNYPTGDYPGGADSRGAGLWVGGDHGTHGSVSVL